MTHIPVLIKEVLHYLNPQSNENFIDGTVGQGGHSLEILKKNGPDGMVLGLDQDSQQIENAALATHAFEKRIILINDSYVNLRQILQKENFRPVNGILLDLGFSSWQLERSNRGFTFGHNEPLDMRYNLQNTLTAAQIVNEWSVNKIEKILREYGEEKFSKRISKAIVEKRRRKHIQSTLELKEIIISAVGFNKERIHPATRTFQALRIAVNRELENIREVLPRTIEALAKGGRLVVISFHSLEDRIVKEFFNSHDELKVLTKKPITAGQQELLQNPRARSAKLRAAMKI